MPDAFQRGILVWRVSAPQNPQPSRQPLLESAGTGI